MNFSNTRGVIISPFLEYETRILENLGIVFGNMIIIFSRFHCHLEHEGFHFFDREFIGFTPYVG